MSQTVTFRRPDGKSCDGYYVEPAAGAPAPGVVVIQEWWGVNDQIRGVADRLCQAGYRVIVPDLYRGKVSDLDAKEAVVHVVLVYVEPVGNSHPYAFAGE